MAVEQSDIGILGVSGRAQFVKAISVNAATGAASDLPPGRSAAASSYPTALSNEDYARLAAIAFGASAATVSIIPSATGNTQIAPANAARIGVIIANDSTSIMYVLLGAGTASVANYSFQVPAKGTIPSDRQITGYTGVINASWAAANGNALVTVLV